MKARDVDGTAQTEHREGDRCKYHPGKQEQEAASARNDLQFAWCATTVLEWTASRSNVGESESWDASIGVRLGEVGHVLCRVCYELTKRGRLRKDLYERRPKVVYPALPHDARSGRKHESEPNKNVLRGPRG